MLIRNIYSIEDKMRTHRGIIKTCPSVFAADITGLTGSPAGKSKLSVTKSYG
jgi:hypothetical protein